ncbi:MAG: 50S ribosomal protein L21 [candidate division TA06 bacterium ADurb.Bin417]|uniref:Large ribosomal subunit protein bL21 n=1 Tax=candidate division TA06 bacterium ADurb.Bin417 TaxID=1852828 RepID=A0A1V5MD55_UNCT6|nr:MAG: 50S ribosomal protein L21 [candidate division TA06 bacterium ADurb.Bin417]
MFAIIETGGKQYQVTPGARLKVEKLAGAAGEKVVFKRVLLFSTDDGAVLTGADRLSEVKVKGRILEQGKARKVVVFKRKPKTDYNKLQGHRQGYTLVEIEEISKGKKA